MKRIYTVFCIILIMSVSVDANGFDYYIVTEPEQFESANPQAYPTHYGTYVDEAYGTTIRRITDGPRPPADGGVRPNYIAKQHSIENVNGSLIYVAARNIGAGAVYTASDGVYRCEMTKYEDAYDNFCWSPQVPNEGYLFVGGTPSGASAKFYKVTINTSSWSVSYTLLDELTAADFPSKGGEGFVQARIHDESPTSWDGRHWAVIAQYDNDYGNENQASYMAWYDRDLNGPDSPGIRGIVAIPGGLVYNTGISPGGNFIYFRSYDNTEACSSGTCVWSYPKENFTGTVNWQTAGSVLGEASMGYHYCLAYDDLGNEVYVTNYSPSSEYFQVAYWIFNKPGDENRVTIANRTDWRPASGGSGYGDSHVGTVGVSAGAREWIAILPTDSGGDGKDECGYENVGASTITFAKCSASDPTIWRVAHARNDAGSYSYQLFSAASRNGQSFYFNTNWCNQDKVSGGEQMQLFRVELPTNWWEEAGGPLTRPTATATANPTIGLAPLSVGFSGSGTDPNGSISSYRWVFGDGGSSNTRNPNHIYNQAGSYNAILTVTDNSGETDSDTVSVLVGPEGQTAPTAIVLGGSALIGTAPLNASFNGSGMDYDGSIVSYSWDFGDGGSSSAQNTSHVYDQTGTFIATLTVVDDNGETGTASVSILIEDEDQTDPPAASTGNSSFICSYDFDDSNATDMASKYSLIVSKIAEAPAVAIMKAQNSQVKALHYDNALTHGTEYYVYDSVSGKKIVHKDWNWYLHDISNENYRTSLANHIASNLNAYPQFDGVFLDDNTYNLDPSYFYQEGTTAAVNLPLDLAENWQAHMVSLLQAVKTAIGTKLLFLNTSWYASEYLDIADGQMDENFAHANWEGPDQFLGLNSWKDHLNALQAAAAGSKYYLAQSGVKDGATLDQINKLVLYTYTSFLMGVPSGNTYAKYYFCPSMTYQDHYYHPVLDVDMGEPEASYVAVEGTTACYRRNFEKGIALVNPGDSATGSIDLGGTFYTLESDPVTQVSLSAREGRILLKSISVGWGSIESLTIVDEAEGTSEWSIQAGVLVQGSNIFAGTPDDQSLDKLGTFAYDPSHSWSSFQATMNIMSQDDDTFGVMFRYQDPDNYYRFSWDSQRAYRRLVKKQNGTFSLLAEDAVPYVRDRDYQLKIVALKNSIEIWIDGAKIFTAADSSLQEGNIAMYSWGNAGSYFGEVSVQEFGADGQRPASPSGFEIINVSE